MEYSLIVHAGGKGTRLRPLTLNIPKVLLPVGDKKLLDYVLAPWLDFGIKEVIVTVSFKAEQIKEFFKENYPDLNVKFIYEDEPSGRSGAIKLGIRQDILNPDKSYIMILGDDIVDIDIPKLLDFHNSHSKEVTLILAKQYNNPYGVAHLSGNQIINFKEKPLTSLPDNYGINTGAAVLKNLRTFLNTPIPSNPEDALYPELAKVNQIVGFFANEWNSVNTKSEYKQVVEKFS